MTLARRPLLAAAASLAAPRPAWAGGLARGLFSHGVASGDPTADSVVLWTRFVGGDSDIAWEVAEDEAFARVVARGAARASFANDYCVKAEAHGLAPGQRYFYRFLSASGPSPTGRTMTAPDGAANALRVALFSCANIGFGYFHAYRHAAARTDIDLILHAGDYLYELRRGAYPSAAETVPGRAPDPAGETVTLAEYYQRYGAYHADSDLTELRRSAPICAIWDDHEIADNAWRDGALGHWPQTEGTYVDRVAAAMKAYNDWMPLRTPQWPRTHRAFDWGDLARVLVLDTRLAGRDPPLDYRRALSEAGADARAAAARYRREALDLPARTMLGEAQERWFANALSDSARRGQPWQIVLQQVVMGEQTPPGDLARLLNHDAPPASRTRVRAAAQAAALGLPWNVDAWAGYPAARARLLQACEALANNAVVLAGDSHNCWLNNLALPGSGRMAAVEFAGGSVTSPGLERILARAGPGEREAAMRDANPALAWCDLTRRGYGVLSFSRTACTAEWTAFDDVRSPIAAAPVIARFVAEPSARAGPGAWTDA